MSDSSKNSSDSSSDVDKKKGRASSGDSNSDSSSSSSDSDSSKSSSSSSTDKKRSSAEKRKRARAQPDPDDDSRESPQSSSTGSPAKHQKRKERIAAQLWDENPDMYGIRRSGRSRKEPERLNIKEGSESEDRPRGRRKSSGDWNSGAASTGTDVSSNYSDVDQAAKRVKAKVLPSRSIRNQKKTTKNNGTKASNSKPRGRKHNASVGGSKGRRNRKLSSSSDESDYDSDEDDKGRITAKRKTMLKVSYKEQSADETGSEDLVEVEYTETAAEADNAETVERILASRLGKKGATGGLTTIYAIEDNGDPNASASSCGKDELEKQYFIKWKNWSHIHNTWESMQTLKDQKVKGLKKLENFIKKEDDINSWKRNATPEEIEYYECQTEMSDMLKEGYMKIERIIADKKTNPEGDNDQLDYLCKWEGLPYSDCTWEDDGVVKKKYKHHVQAYLARQKCTKIPSTAAKVLKIRPKFVPLKEQPKYIGSTETYELRDYQLDGLNWLAHSWCKENSVILADEMGLGKTIQTISYLSYLFNNHHLFGPFLIVVPLSTMTAWQKEFEQWAPEFNVLIYLGDVDSRNVIRQHEWSHESNGRLKFNALITTYEILLKDKGFLDKVAWAELIVDEAHRLKNDDSLLYKSLFEFDTNHRLLITGTPLQNSLKELWSLLHFIMKDTFDSWEDFEQQHTNAAEKGYSKLHKQLEPYILRRVKKDVEKSLPAKVEQILRVEMTTVQKQYYKWILTKNYKALSKGIKGNITGFINIVMELKKCCNHGFLVRLSDQTDVVSDPLQYLIRGSGKLVLLDKLLVRLKETGHRVLIFSQMVRMLDLLSEYLQLRHFTYQRLDGGIKGELRRQALDHFNAEGSQDFCFLLSTRAGGLGINLATADTVIIFDSDWNPQNDLQAQARAHRIGQKNQVNIYRLVTKGSVEEDIIERAKKKMVLDHLVIQRMDTTGRTVLSKSATTTNSTPFNKIELASILKFGAEELFKENDDDEQEMHMDIDEILRRAETREQEDSSTVGDELLSAFKVASFAAWDEEQDVPKIEQPASEENTKDWDDIIPEVDRKKIEALEKQKEMEDLYLPPRSRKTVRKTAANSDSDEAKSRPKSKRRQAEEESASDGESSDSDHDKKKPGRPRSSRNMIKGFTDAEVRRFVKSYKKFAAPMKRLDAISLDSELQEKPLADLKRLGEMLREACDEAMHEHKLKIEEAVMNDDSSNLSALVKKRDRGPTFKLSGVTINAKQVLICEADLAPLDILLPGTAEERKKWVLDSKVKEVHWDVAWEVEDDTKLIKGIYEHGLGNWEQIKMDPLFGLGDKILLNDTKKPQGKHLQTRAEYLLKVLGKIVDLQQGVKRKRKIREAKKKAAISKAIIENDVDSDDDAELKKKRNKEFKDGLTDDRADGKENDDRKKSKERDKKERRRQVILSKFDPKKSKVKKDGPMHFTANAEPVSIDVIGNLDPKSFDECKEKMRPVKKWLKVLDKPDTSLNEKDKLNHMHQCLIKIGDRINECLTAFTDPDMVQKWRSNLWYFVSKFTEYDAKKLYKMYKQAMKKSDMERGSPKKISPNKGEKLSGKSPVKAESSGKHRSKEDNNYRNDGIPRLKPEVKAGSSSSNSSSVKRRLPGADNPSSEGDSSRTYIPSKRPYGGGGEEWTGKSRGSATNNYSHRAATSTASTSNEKTASWAAGTPPGTNCARDYPYKERATGVEYRPRDGERVRSDPRYHPYHREGEGYRSSKDREEHWVHSKRDPRDPRHSHDRHHYVANPRVPATAAYPDYAYGAAGAYPPYPPMGVYPYPVEAPGGTWRRMKDEYHRPAYERRPPPPPPSGNSPPDNGEKTYAPVSKSNSSEKVENDKH